MGSNDIPSQPQAMTAQRRAAFVAQLRAAGSAAAASEIEAMQAMLNQMIPVMNAAVRLVCAPGWDVSTTDDAGLERVLRAAGLVAERPEAAALNKMARHQMNEQLCAFADRWLVDGDYMRCRKCKRPHIASRAAEAFQHMGGCKLAEGTESHPWLTFQKLMRPLAHVEIPNGK